MKLQAFAPRTLGPGVRRFLRPGRNVAFFFLLILLFLACISDFRLVPELPRASEGAIVVFGLALLGFCLSRSESASQRGFEYALSGAFVLAISHIWLKYQHFEFSWLFFACVVTAAAIFGARSSLILAAIITLLLIAGRHHALKPPSMFWKELAEQSAVMAASALLAGYFTGANRRRIAALREELARAKSTPFAYGTAGVQVGRTTTAGAASGEPGASLDSLDQNLLAILQRVKSHLRAHSVVLFLPSTPSMLSMHQALSDSPHLERDFRLDLHGSLLGRACVRGVGCNWNLDDPDCQVTAADIGYYGASPPVRNLAAFPLLSDARSQGLLVIDRSARVPFSEIELLHLETFAIQLVEIIQMGRRYLEQVDRNMEYRLFYAAVTRMGQSLATAEMVEALAGASEEIAPASHIIIALLDGSGSNYEIAYAKGVEKLQGSRQRSRGRSWVAWMLQSDTGPLLLRDIRSHESRMPIASLSEGSLAVRSVMLIPLSAKNRRIGVAFLGSGVPDAYQNWQLRLMSMLCGHAAAGIENSLLHRQVEEEALSDGLTRLKNHRYFQERMKSECSRARRQHRPLSLLMIDIDHFKTVNDTFGHRVGDIILQQSGEILKAAVRSEDAVARYGGEEFVVILADSDRKGALRTAERARQAVERATFLAEGHQVQITVSIGTASFPEDGIEPLDLIGRSDRALYAAKDSGRNRTVQYHEAPSTDAKALNG